MTCHCESCSKDPLPTYTQKFKYESFVKQIAMRDGDSIREFLKGFKEKRGEVEYKKLRSEVLKVWRNK